MPQIASHNELQSAVDTIIGYVDAHDNEPYSTNVGNFLVCYAKIEVPRVIGERTASFLRLFKALSGDVLAGVLYNEFGYKAWEDSDVYPEMPVRSITLNSDLMTSTHVWEGTSDANDREITSSLASELISDISKAAPYEPSLRPTQII